MGHTMMTTRELWHGLGTIGAILGNGIIPYGLYYTFVKKKYEYSWRLKVNSVCIAFVFFFWSLSATVLTYKQEYLSIIPWFTDKNPEYVFHIFASIAVYGMWIFLNCVCIMGMIWADELAEVVYKDENAKKTRKDFFLFLLWSNMLGWAAKFLCKV